MEEQFRVFDFHRIFIGEAPPLFLLEIVFRTIIMYAYAVTLLRILGKRGMGQMSMLELAIIISFGSAVGDPMIGADMPVFHGMVAITVVTVFQIGLERLINKNRKVEAVLEGRPNILVQNGVIKWDCMMKDNLSKEDLFRALRTKDVEHLGQVSKVFFETTGDVSIFFNPPKRIKPGLSVLPEEMIPGDSIFDAAAAAPKDQFMSCLNCGHTSHFKTGEAYGTCSDCGHARWVRSAY